MVVLFLIHTTCMMQYKSSRRPGSFMCIWPLTIRSNGFATGGSITKKYYYLRVQLKYLRHVFSQCPNKPAQASHHIHYMQAGKHGLLTASRQRRAAVSLVNSFQLREWISPNWISLRLSRQPTVTKQVGAPPPGGHRLPRKHCQSQANAFLATLVSKSCQGNTCSPASLSCDSQ